MSATAELRKISVFSGLDDAALERIANEGTFCEFPSGQVLIEAGAPAPGLFAILDGTVHVHARSGERDLGAGEIVGELALLRRDGGRTARVQAKSDVRCLAIARDAFRRLIESEPAVAIALLEHVADRYGD